MSGNNYHIIITGGCVADCAEGAFMIILLLSAWASHMVKSEWGWVE